jgi:Fe-S oxidoreductase
MPITESNAEFNRLLDSCWLKTKLMLSVCAHCTMCADSCFLYQTKGKDPEYTPGYKFVNSVGRITRKKGRLTEKEWDAVRELAFRKCVLCMRCYCPLGINIPEQIALARSFCRIKGKNLDFENTFAHKEPIKI